MGLTSLDSLNPFKNTMLNAALSTGQAPSGLNSSSSTSAIANFFHELVVAPSGQPNSGSTLGNILNYFSTSLVQKPQTQQQAIVQSGLQNTLNKQSALSSPITWIVILGVIVLAIVLIKKFI